MRLHTCAVLIACCGLLIGCGGGGGGGDASSNPPPADTAPAITSTTSAHAVVGTAFSFMITTTGSPVPTITTNLPASGHWLSLSGTTLSGTPASGDVGTDVIIITAENRVSSVNQTFMVIVDATLQPPYMPSGLTVQAITSSRIDVIWVDTANNESGFELEMSVNGTGAWTNVATLPANATSYTVTGLAPETPYHFRIRAVNVAGNSPWSNVVDVTTPVAGLPAAPTNIRVTSLTATEFTIEWDDNADNEGGYRLLVTDYGRYHHYINLYPNATSFNSSYLGLLSATPSTEYHFYVATSVDFYIGPYNWAPEEPTASMSTGFVVTTPAQ